MQLSLNHGHSFGYCRSSYLAGLAALVMKMEQLPHISESPKGRHSAHLQWKWKIRIVSKSNLKGLSHQIKFAWKWYDSLGLGKDMWRWTFKNFFTLHLILNCLLKFLCDPHKTLTNLLFLRKSASVATWRLRIFTLLLPIVAGVALDVLGNRKVQLFRHTNTGGFLLCP
jgi:hypothetical protein